MLRTDLPHYLDVNQVTAAEALLQELLAAGPMRPCEVRAVAAERGLRIREDAWAFARRSLRVESSRHGRVWLWTLPADTLLHEIAEWLLTPRGRFAAFLAERDRKARINEETINEETEQLRLL